MRTPSPDKVRVSAGKGSQKAGRIHSRLRALSRTHTRAHTHWVSEWWRASLFFTFLTDLRVGTAVNAAEGISPTFMFTSLLFLLTVNTEYFSATFSVSLTYFVACLTSALLSTTESVIAPVCGVDAVEGPGSSVELVPSPSGLRFRSSAQSYRLKEKIKKVVHEERQDGGVSSLLSETAGAVLVLSSTGTNISGGGGAFGQRCHLNKWAGCGRWQTSQPGKGEKKTELYIYIKTHFRVILYFLIILCCTIRPWHSCSSSYIGSFILAVTIWGGGRKYRLSCSDWLIIAPAEEFTASDWQCEPGTALSLEGGG